MKVASLQLPSMRNDLTIALSRLSDADFQEQSWKKKTVGYPQFPRFLEIMNFLYDDTRLSSDPSFCIGAFLLNEQEADAIRAVTASIDLMLERHGWKDHDADYLTLSEWSAVIKAARDAHALIGPDTEER